MDKTSTCIRIDFNSNVHRQTFSTIFDYMYKYWKFGVWDSYLRLISSLYFLSSISSKFTTLHYIIFMQHITSLITLLSYKQVGQLSHAWILTMLGMELNCERLVNNSQSKQGSFLLYELKYKLNIWKCLPLWILLNFTQYIL